ncbi:MAG: hypothetical protein Q7S07_01920 [Candidatus Omnitrophota bacterium]|nr:hypothetical protein [Candidatus Omnitrophota bacterium]
MKKQTIITLFCSLLFATPAFSELDTSKENVITPGYAASELGQPAAEGISITRQGIVQETEIQAQPVLKRIDINRIGSAPSYETFEGLRFAKYFTIAQRVEIFQEARPIDAYVLDAKKIRWLHWNQPWNTDGEYRQQIRPIFTRAYGTEVTMSDPKNKEGQIRYTHDYRDIYQNQFPIYILNPQQLTPTTGIDIPYTRNTNYKHEQWDQNDILFMHSKRIPGIEWYETINIGYRYSTMSAKNDKDTDAYYETRHTYFTYFSLAPSERLELFGQLEYFKSKRPKSTFTYNPNHYFAAAELRMKSKDLKTSVIPRMSYSVDYYYPFKNTFTKYEMQFRIGHDFTPKLNAASTFRCVMSVRDEKDNTTPSYLTSNPIHDMSGWVGVENRMQYQFYNKLWFQGGLDYAAGTNMSAFDNIGFLTGLEYYAPGLIRVDVGYRGNDYYNIDDWLSSVYFKVFLFM